MTISEERKKRVIDLYYNQGKTTREIAKIERMSIRDISAILKEEEEEKNNSAVTNNQKQRQELSSRAYELFSKGKTSVEVAIALNLTEPKVSKMYRGYWKLRRLDKLIIIHKETNGKLWPFLKLYKQLIKQRGMSVEQVVNVVEIAIHKLPYMENLYRQAKDQAEKMQRTVQRLANDIRTLERKISLLDKIAFSSEQECKRTEQRVQELTAKKDRIEKLIATMLSDDDEDYTKLKTIVKESVKDVLSDNKTLISTAFAALLQTLKTDPQMVKLIQNIPSAADDDNDSNNITKYFEINRHSLLNLGEKNYENLVEAFTKNAIDIAASSSSPHNPTLSLPQSSSSTFSNSFDQIDTFKKE